MKRFLVCSLLMLVLGGCSVMIQSFRYSDGSGNSYTLSADRKLVYHPVQPRYSSSGYYSGGNPYTLTLSPEDYQRLLKLVQAAQKDTASHIQRREMGSGLLSIEGAEPILLSPQSELKATLERYLKQK